MQQDPGYQVPQGYTYNDFVLELYQNYSSKGLIVSGVYVPIYNELSTKRTVFVS